MRQHNDSSAPHALDAFLDVAGHELRIPITALKGQVQLMQRRLRREVGRERDLADLDKIAYQVERLTHEVDIYLAAAHIAERRLIVQPELGDLAAVVARLVGIYSAGAAGHVVRLESSIESLPGVFDKRRAEQALGVLLANALKYSPSGEVVVRLRERNGAALLEVLDRGVGVLAKDRKHIFARYGRGSNIENAGAGLGLYVARELVTRQGGHIGVRARPEGGSIFWIELPLQEKSALNDEPQAETLTAVEPEDFVSWSDENTLQKTARKPPVSIGG
jgi:signal transduction histidine kinase